MIGVFDELESLFDSESCEVFVVVTFIDTVASVENVSDEDTTRH